MPSTVKSVRVRERACFYWGIALGKSIEAKRQTNLHVLFDEAPLEEKPRRLTNDGVFGRLARDRTEHSS